GASGLERLLELHQGLRGRLLAPCRARGLPPPPTEHLRRRCEIGCATRNGASGPAASGSATERRTRATKRRGCTRACCASLTMSLHYPSATSYRRRNAEAPRG